jgi:hypothetical protein
MRWLLCALLSLAASPAHAQAQPKDAYISMMYSNAIDQTSPFELVRTGSWKAEPSARYVKLHVYLDEPVPMSAVEVDACDPPAGTLQYSLWVNFDESTFGRAPDDGKEEEEEASPYPSEGGFSGKTFYARRFAPGTQARSLTFNFESWRGVSLCGLRVYDENGQPYKLHVPSIVAGSATASSTLSPTAAYDVMNLFDSRFEYAWASAGQASDVDLAFAFAEPQRVEKLRLWNGYQRSGAHCIANSRAKWLVVSGEGGYSTMVEVADQLGSQVVALPKPFVGRELHIHVADAYLGKSYKDLVISELRLWNGADWFALDSLPMMRAAAKSNRELFDAAGLTGMLNQSYFADGSEAGGFSADEATLRLRADGSFYFRGTGPSASGHDDLKDYFTLGNFEIKTADPSKGVRLRLFGLYYETDAYGDCNGCGRDCNRPDDRSAGRIFEEYVTVKAEGRKADDLVLRIDNESGGKKLPFKTLHLRLETRTGYQ